jgi:hypothetical protein
MKNHISLTFILAIATTSFCADIVQSFKPFKTTITSASAPSSLQGKTLTIDFCFTDEELRTDRDYTHAPIAKSYLDNNPANPTQLIYFGLDTSGVQHYILEQWMKKTAK